MYSIQSFALKALAPMGAVLGLGVVFRQDVVDSIVFTPHPAIVFIIFGMSGMGLLLLLLNLWHLWQDHRLLSGLLSLDASQRLERLQAVQRLGGRFRALAGRLSAASPWDRRQQLDDCEVELNRVHQFYNEALSFPGFLGGALVGMGLVGTFIGLLGALGDIAELISGLSVMNNQNGNVMEMFAQLVKQLQNPMKSMATAFVASLYGLLGSMTLGFTLFAHRKFVPLMLNEWRTLSQDVLLQAAPERIAQGANPAENLQIAITEAEQWKELFAQLRVEHQQVLDHCQHLQRQASQQFEQFQVQQQRLLEQQDAHHQAALTRQEAWQQAFLERQEARHQDMQQHTWQQVEQIQADTRELARVLHERNDTDALVRRALGEGEHWMQTLMQLQEMAQHHLTSEQLHRDAELATARASTQAMQRLMACLQRTEERQQLDMQQLAGEVRELSAHWREMEATAEQWSSAWLHNLQLHQSVMQDSVHKLRTWMSLQLGEPGLVKAPQPDIGSMPGPAEPLR